MFQEIVSGWIGSSERASRAGEFGAFRETAGYRWRSRPGWARRVCCGRLTLPRRPAMSLKTSPIQPVPEETARVARAAFRKGNPLLSFVTSLAPFSPTPTSPTCSPGSASRGCRLGGWRWSPSCSSARICPTGGPLRRCGRASTGSTSRAWSSPTPASTTRCCASSAHGCSRVAPRSGCCAAARGVPGPGPAQGARPAADRRDLRPGGDPGAEPAGAGRRDLARGPERAGHGGAGLAAGRRSPDLVQALRAPRRGRPAAPGRGGT